MARCLLVFAALAVLAGCQSQADQWTTMVLPTTDYQAAFDTARDVIAKEYGVASANPTEGRIDARPMPLPHEGNERKLGAYLSSGDVQNFRRTILCRLEPGEAGVVAHVSARLEREGTSQAETLIISSQDHDRRQAGAERRWAYLEPKQASYWADIGRDQTAEQDLVDHIRARIVGAAGAVAP